MHPTMKVLLSTILTICCLSTLNSQVEYDLTLRFGNGTVDSESFSSTYDYTQYSQIEPNRYTISDKTSTIFYNIDYSKLTRFEIAAHLTIPITNGLHIKTGLGLSRQKIVTNLGTLDAQYTTNSIDTLEGIIPTITINPNFKPCQYQNSYSDIVQPSDQSNIWSLMVPLEFEYDLLHRLAIRAGGYLQTPIISSHKTYSIRSEVIEEQEDYNLCQYELNTIKDTNGSKFNDLVLGMSLGVSYGITHHISAEVMYRHSLSGAYAEPTESFGIINRRLGEFKNRSVMLGLSYKFGDHKSHEEVVEQL